MLCCATSCHIISCYHPMNWSAIYSPSHWSLLPSPLPLSHTHAHTTDAHCVIVELEPRDPTVSLQRHPYTAPPAKPSEVHCALIHTFTCTHAHLYTVPTIDLIWSRMWTPYIYSYNRLRLWLIVLILLCFSLTAQQAIATISDEKEEAVLGPVIFTAPNGKDTTVSTVR